MESVMGPVKREFLWVIGVVALSFLMVWAFFGVPWTGSFDINIYDTYLVVGGLYLFFLMIAPIGLLIYAVRALMHGFQTAWVNLILSFFIFMTMLWTTWILLWIGEGFSDPIGPWRSIVGCLYILNASLGIALFYVGYRTGLK